MRMIQSSSNPSIQKVKKIVKNRQERLFLIEGKKLLMEAADAGLNYQEIFVTPEVWAKEQSWLEPQEHRGASVYLVNPRLMKLISDVETPQGILGLAQKPSPAKSQSILKFALFLNSIRDPGNFGAILRTAEASGCEWVAYSSDCVDPFLPKVVRASMGSLFRVPLLEIINPGSFLKQELQPNVQTCGLITRNGRSLFEWRPQFPVVVCIGSETQGLPQNLPLTEKLSIPMKGKVESLNAAVAAAICLYKISSFTESSR
jgi:RNA methyltransferase, TrmH family